MEKRVVHILWTGGLESTYRVVELSQTDCIIQPHYIIYKYRGKRESKDYELRAIHKITDILRKDERTRATILPPIIFNFNDEGNKTEDGFYKYVITFFNGLGLIEEIALSKNEHLETGDIVTIKEFKNSNYFI